MWSTEKEKSTLKSHYLKTEVNWYPHYLSFYDHSNRALHKFSKFVAEQVRNICSGEEINSHFGIWIYNNSQLQP